MFFLCSKLNIRKAGICKKGLYATFSSWHIDPCRFPVKICFLEKLMTFLTGTDDASRNRKAGRRAAA